MKLNIQSSFTTLLMMACVITKASADTLSDWAGDYSGDQMFGGWGGTWGNAGSVSFSVTCDGKVLVGGTEATGVNYGGDGALSFTMASGRIASITLADTLTNSYHFRDTSVFPGNTCTGGCFSGSVSVPGSGPVDFRGTLTASALPCPCSGGCGGDPHFKLWNGSWFDFHGICDLVLVHAKDFADGLGLRIHIRPKERFGYSFIETVAIQVGQDVLEVGSYGQFFLNGVEGADLPSTMGNAYSLTHEQENKKRHHFTIQIGKEEAIKVSTAKDMVNIFVEKATETNFGSSVGLMGSYRKGEMLARDGFSIIENHNDFGQEWQVTADEPNLFEGIPDDKVPQHPMKCYIPVAKTSRRLGESVAQHAAEKACAKYDGTDKFDMCVFDVMAMGDLEVADVHGAF